MASTHQTRLGKVVLALSIRLISLVFDELCYQFKKVFSVSFADSLYCLVDFLGPA